MAVAPLLIVLMISSLANFLALVLYHGPYPSRVAWTLLMFTLGAVGIARVAIEQDRAYSLGYAVVLGLVTLVTMIRFVGSPLFSAFTLILIGYLSDRIVRDCTLIDERVDASGQGLLDRRSEPASAGRHRGEPHQPGRTVLYLSLAALPLFGLGQFFLRGSPPAWSRAQWLLAVYLFAGLSLLVTTSFLGLRRYLRQRDAEMPPGVSVAWLAGGGLMVALVVGAAMLAPLPGQTIASLRLPDWLESPSELTASRFGWGDEGAEQSAPDAAQTAGDPQAASKEPGGTRAEPDAAPGDVGSGQRDSGPAGNQSGNQQSQSGGGESDPSDSSGSDDAADAEATSSESSQGEASSSESSSSEASSGAGRSPELAESRTSESGASERESGESDTGESATGGNESGGEPSPDGANGNEPGESEPGQREPGEDRPEGAESEPPEPAAEDSSRREGDAAEESSGTSSARPPAGGGLPDFGALLRPLLMLILAAVVLGFLWFYREAILQWWQDLLGRSPAAPLAETSEPAGGPSAADPAPRRFASFRNPLGDGADPRRAVIVTFQAFEAWSRERGWQRGREETPSEFIRRVARSMPEMSSMTAQLVDAYNRIVYGRGQATPGDLEAASQLWRVMQREGSRAG